MTLPDGFVAVDSHQLVDAALNINFVIDEFSPFVDRGALSSRADELIVDRYYGQAYHAIDLRPAAIYGRTADLPTYSGDELANHGFLRVPFRRIPRHIVRSRTEIEALLASIRSFDNNLRILFRGQTREHLISRSPETTQWLYGEDNVAEPSLTTSASRRAPALEEISAEWAALLQLFLGYEGEQSGKSDLAEMATTFGLPLFALALAQHYGLPTSGLDVTTSLDVALFFALMKYERPGDDYRATYSRIAELSEMPVIYVLSPAQQQQFDYESYRLKGFPSGRPDAQSAYFMHCGWGYMENACAARIFLAVYLDPDGEYGPIPSAAALFPNGQFDPFAQFLEGMRRAPLSERLTSALREHFYTIISES